MHNIFDINKTGEIPGGLLYSAVGSLLDISAYTEDSVTVYLDTCSAGFSPP
jgi:hypothetical protein